MIPGIVAGGIFDAGPPPAGDYGSVVVSDGPTHYLRFEETSGTAIADEMGGSNWTIAGTYSLGMSGAIGNAIDFTSAGIAHPAVNDLPGAAPLSFEFWIYLSSADSPSNSYLISRINRFDVVFNYGGANMVGIFRNAAPTIATSALQVAVPRDDAWHHVVITYDDTIIRGYLDGSEVDTHSVSNAGSMDNQTCTIGRSTSSSDPFNGGLDEVALYDYALTPTQVAAHYAAASA